MKEEGVHLQHLGRWLAVAVATVGLAGPGAALAQAQSFPQQNVLPVWPDNPNDASANVGDIPYDEIAPKLNALQAASNRVSARVAGKSAGGYDLYDVVLTAPETEAQYAQQEAWKQWLEDDPVVARTDPALLAGYKTPLFVNGNIHGNEKEGADAHPQAARASGRRAPTRPSRRCCSATASSSTSRRTRTAASPTRARTPPATTSTVT